jgi:hypothetical protein
MSLVAAAAITTIAGGVIGIGSAIGKFGSGASQQDINVQLGAAEEMYQEKLGLLGEQRGLAGQAAELGYSAAQNQFAGGQRDVTMGTQTGMRNIQAGAATAASRSGLATSGTIQQQTKTQSSDLLAKAKSDMTKLFDTRELAGKQRDLSINEATLSYRQGAMSAEEAHEAMKLEIGSQKKAWEF